MDSKKTKQQEEEAKLLLSERLQSTGGIIQFSSKPIGMANVDLTRITQDIQLKHQSQESARSNTSLSTINLEEDIPKQKTKEFMTDNPKKDIEQLNDNYVNKVIFEGKSKQMKKLIQLTGKLDLKTFWQWQEEMGLKDVRPIKDPQTGKIKTTKHYEEKQVPLYIKYLLENSKNDKARENFITELREQLNKIGLSQEETLYDEIINEIGRNIAENKRAKVEESKTVVRAKEEEEPTEASTTAIEKTKEAKFIEPEDKPKKKSKAEKALNETEKAMTPENIEKAKHLLDKTGILEHMKGMSEDKKALFQIKIIKKIEKGYIKEGMSDKEILDYAKAEDKDLEYLSKYKEMLQPLLERVQTNLSFKKSLVEHKSNFGQSGKKKGDKQKVADVKIDPQSGYKMRNFE